MADSALDKDTSLSSVHLNAVRGCAALLVVAGHERGMFFGTLVAPSALKDAGAASAANAMESGITLGHEAVMVFFVLSGFLVGGSVLKLMSKDLWSWKDYMLKRLTRLWIVLIPALLLGLGLDLAGSHLFSGAASIYSAPAGQTYVNTPDIMSLYRPGVFLGNVFFLQNIFVPTAGTNLALWSLSNEFWYYVAFPMLLLGLNRKLAPSSRALYLLSCAAILVAAGAHTSFLFLIWMVGAAIGSLPLKFSQNAARWGSVLIATLLAAAFVEVKTHVANIYAGETIIALLFAFLLYLILHQRRMAARGVYSSLSGFFSRISYTLYLVHLPILVFLCACFNTPWHLWSKTPSNGAIFASLFGLTIGLAWLFYLLFEANTDLVRKSLALMGQRRFLQPGRGGA